MRAALDAVQAAGISYSVFDDVSIEPTDSRYQIQGHFYNGVLVLKAPSYI